MTDVQAGTVSSLRQGLNPRQAETAERLLAAGEVELEEVGPEALTIRTVAHRAGVSPATAYTYLASKHHLFAELFWRRLSALEPPSSLGDSALERVQAVTRQMAGLLASSPHLATAANLALLGTDPEVDRLRIKIGASILGRFTDAVGEPEAPALVESLTYAFSGALLQAGMGLLTYEELADRLDTVAAVILEGHR